MRKTRSFWMRILVLILILSIMPFSALADGYVIENISAESYVDEFGQMVESFTVRFAEGTDLTGITKANVFVENNYTHPYTPEFSNGVERVFLHGNAMVIDVSPFLYEMGFVVSCVKNGQTLFSFTKDNVDYMATEVVDEFEFFETDVLAYRVFKPDSDEKQPLIIWFHGGGEHGEDGMAPLVDYRAAVCWAEPLYQEQHPCAVLVPQLPEGKTWMDEDVLADVREQADKLIADGVVDPDRVYVVGFSYYQGALWFTTENLDLVAATLHLLYWHAYDPDPKTGDEWGGVGWKEIAEAELPLWSCGALDDPTLGTEEMLTYHIPYMEANNPNFHYSTWTTEEMYDYRCFGFLMHHGWIPAINNQEIIDWLFAQSK